MQKRNVEVGDIVRYTATWLRSVGCYTGPVPFNTGVVIALINPTRDWTLAVVNWADKEVSPERVNVHNLEVL